MTIDSQETVALVLAPDYGPRLRDLCARANVWAVDSAMNHETATEIWAALIAGAQSPITVFDWTPDESASDTILRMLDTIEEHHPHCANIEFIGANTSPYVLAELDGRGYSNYKRTEQGFFASKHAL